MVGVPQQIYEPKKWTFVSAAQSTIRAGTLEHHQPAIVLSDSLAASARALGIIDDFWRHYLPRVTGGSLTLDGLGNVPWAVAVNLKAFPEAVKACAFMILGDLRHNQDYIDAGRNFYISCLRKLNEHLRSPQCLDSTAAIATCKALSMYEHMRKDDGNKPKPGTQMTDWIRHVKGMCQIMALGSSDTTFDSSLSENVHLNLVTVNIMSRKTVLKPERWCPLPGRQHYRSRLFAIMDDLPPAFEAQDRLIVLLDIDDSQHVAQQVSALLDRLQDITRRLSTWEQDMLEEIEYQGWGSPFMPKYNSQYDQSSLYGITLYWTACLLTSATVMAVVELCGHLSACQWPEKTAYLWLQPRRWTKLIAAQVHQFYTPGSGLWGQEAATFPIGMVRRYCWAYGLEDCEEMQVMAEAIDGASFHENTNAFLRSAQADVPGPVPMWKLEAQFRYAAKKWHGLLRKVNRAVAI